MPKKYAGWTEKRWREALEWQIASRQFTTGSKASTCFKWRRMLIQAGDWDALPLDIKYNIQLYAFLYQETYPRMAKEQKMSIENRINVLEAEKQAFIKELELLNRQRRPE